MAFSILTIAKEPSLAFDIWLARRLSIRDHSQQLSSDGWLVSWSMATIDYAFLQLVSFFLTSKCSQNKFSLEQNCHTYSFEALQTSMNWFHVDY